MKNFKLLLFLCLPLTVLAQLNPLPALNSLSELQPLASNRPESSYLKRIKAEREKNIELYQIKLRNEIRWQQLKRAYAKIPLSYFGPIPNNYIWLVLYGIAQGVETGNMKNAYSIRNPFTSAHGMWQMTDGFWQHYSYLYCDSLGITRHILPRTPANQRAIAYFAAKQMFRRHKKTGRDPITVARWIAKEWYGGIGHLSDDWNSIPNPSQNTLTFNQYANRVVARMKIINKKKPIKFFTRRK